MKKNIIQTPYQPITALYERLSREDEAQGDSNSIVNQKKKLHDYAVKHGFTNLVHYTDDGYSGSNFDRPAWKRMKQDIREGKVRTVITKDLSRVGRNYLEVGMFTEVYFPQNGVRFIAIDNGVDTLDQQTVEFAPIMNLVNEFYIRDYSQRMKSAWQAKRIAGLHTSTQCIYGYRKDPSDTEKWVIDQPAAAVVRRIFNLTLKGYNPSQIANLLHRENVEKPSYYRAKHAPNGFHYALPENPFDWSSSTVKEILLCREYTGCTVNHKTERPDYRNHNLRRSIEESEWQIIEGTQEPIVSKEDFEQAGRLVKTSRPYRTFDHSTPLKGVVYCADCGAVMINTQVRPSPVKDRNGELTGKMSKPKDFFSCPTYKNGLRHRKRVCSSHTAKTDALTFLVLETLKSFSERSITDEQGLLQQLNGDTLSADTIKRVKKALNQKRRRCTELDEVIQRTYEDNFKGFLADERLEEVVSQLEAEQEQLEREIAQLEEDISGEGRQKDSRRFLKQLRTVTSFEVLTADMVSQLIDRVIVHERTGKRNHYQQDIEIYFKFVGKILISSQKGGDAE